MGYVRAGVLFSPEITDLNSFQLSVIKGRSRWCMGCAVLINKGDNCIGRASNKFCLKCGRSLYLKAYKTYLELSEIIKEKITELDKNYEELNTENLANKI